MADLTSKSEALEAQTGRQFVVATVKSLEGRTIEDYGVPARPRLGDRPEGQGHGVILLVAPNERKVRIETGYGAGVFLTDAVSSVIIRERSCRASRPATMAAGSTPAPTRSSSR